MTGFIKYMRSEEAEFLLKYPNANHLFMVMAFRARRTDHPMNGLKAGQCFLGDYSSIGMTRQQYRTAQDQLIKWDLATFKGTNRGTIGTILNSKVYDINTNTNNQQITNQQPTSNQQATTNKECKKGNNESKSLVQAEPKRSKFKFTDEDLRFANEMFKRVLVVNPATKKPNLENWANTIRLMRESDNRDHKTMWAVFDWANRDSFWCSNVLSPDKLRKQFDKLQVKKNETNQPRNAPTSRKPSAVDENNARLLEKYGNPTAPSERTINPSEHSGMDTYQVSGGVQQQVATHGVTIDMDAGNISDDGEGDPQFCF